MDRTEIMKCDDAVHQSRWKGRMRRLTPLYVFMTDFIL